MAVDIIARGMAATKAPLVDGRVPLEYLPEGGIPSSAEIVSYDPEQEYSEGSIGKAVQDIPKKAYVAQPGEPTDTNLIWRDTDDIGGSDMLSADFVGYVEGAAYTTGTVGKKINDLNSELSDKVDTETSVNGKELSSDILLDASDINVDEMAEEKVTIAAELSSQSSQIAQLDTLKADKTALQNEVARLTAVNARQDKSIEFLSDAIIGVQAKKVTDSTEAYSKAIPAYPQFTAKMADVKMLGGKSRITFNIWDEEWEVGGYTNQGVKTNTDSRIRCINKIPCLPNKDYYITRLAEEGAIRVNEFDADQNWIKYDGSSGNRIITTDENCHFIVFDCEYGNVYKNDICINLSQTDTTISPHNGDYEPYLGDGIISADCTQIVSDGANIWTSLALANDFKNFLGGAIDTSKRTVSRSASTDIGTLMIPSGVRFKPNTSYTFILNGYSTSSTGTGRGRTNIKIEYTDGSTTDGLYFPEGHTENTPTTVVFVSDSEKTVKGILSFNHGGTAYFYYEKSGIFEGEITEEDFKPYFHQFVIIPQSLREAHPLRSAPNKYDSLDFSVVDGSGKVEHHKGVGNRAYQSGDESDATVITDGTTTNYPLTEEVITDVTSFFPSGFNSILTVEDGGSLTFEQSETEFAIPNSEDIYYVKIPEEVTA